MAVTKVKRKLWSEESMLEAVKSVEDGKGLREAARCYNVLVETLRRRVVGIRVSDLFSDAIYSRTLKLRNYCSKYSENFLKYTWG